ncbi:MAG TPA: hypothetical protein VFQ44_07480 [Streptosporangiaceae bacterium]|nr:hypothetical protein [Streptosporangiaceae bacterium]
MSGAQVVTQTGGGSSGHGGTAGDAQVLSWRGTKISARMRLVAAMASPGPGQSSAPVDGAAPKPPPAEAATTRPLTDPG